MRIEALAKYGIEEDFISCFKKEGLKNLYPPQVKAIEAGLFRHTNLVISAPTASGKTFAATLAILNVLNKRLGKAVYIVPLIALANEKYIYYKNLLSSHKVALSAGDLDSADSYLLGYDLIIATCEKLDSLIRHGAGWIKDLCLIISDEIHLIEDPTRGPTLEILLTQLRKLCPKAQMLALSATISNAKELAGWLNAEAVIDDFRPVKLDEGVCFDSKIDFLQKGSYYLHERDAILGIIKDTLKLKKQALFFVATRRSAESLAEKLSGYVQGVLDSDKKEELNLIAQKALHSLESPTKQCRRLALCLKGGVAFHHAGLVSKQKALIEENFRSGSIKFIVATPTLAMGVNLPAFRVVVRDVKRYYHGEGSRYIPVLEYKQFCGRAGRPQYDSFGESILLAKSEDEAAELFQHYLKGDPEKINSKLFGESSLRTHSLSLISSEFVSSKDGLFKFLQETFFGFQYREVKYLESKIEDVLEQLLEWDFLSKEKDKLSATKLGRRISQLYLEPLNARYFIGCIKQVPNTEEFTPFSLTHIISNNSEMFPLPNVKPKEAPAIHECIQKRKGQFLQSVPDYWDEGYEDFMRGVKLALIFESWTSEVGEDAILESFGMAPGELYSKQQIADWLLFCLQELCKILKEKELISDIRRLRVRMSYGIKEELLSLVMLKGIGRIRGRRLFNSGIRSISDLKKLSKESLASLIGTRISLNVLEQIRYDKP